MALSQRDRRAITIGGGALAAIALYFFVLEPGTAAYARLTRDHSQLAQQIAGTIRDRDKAAYYEERLTEYEAVVGELAPPKPYDEQITTIGTKLLEAAGKAGVALHNANPSAATIWGEDPALSVARFHIDAEVAWKKAAQAPQKWESIYTFIQNVYQIPGVLSVEQFDLTADIEKKPPNDPNLGGKLMLRLVVSVLTESSPEEESPWSW
jgi:hypothetical protein